MSSDSDSSVAYSSSSDSPAADPSSDSDSDGAARAGGHTPSPRRQSPQPLVARPPVVYQPVARQPEVSNPGPSEPRFSIPEAAPAGGNEETNASDEESIYVGLDPTESDDHRDYFEGGSGTSDGESGGFFSKPSVRSKKKRRYRKPFAGGGTTRKNRSLRVRATDLKVEPTNQRTEAPITTTRKVNTDTLPKNTTQDSIADLGMREEETNEPPPRAADQDGGSTSIKSKTSERPVLFRDGKAHLAASSSTSSVQYDMGYDSSSRNSIFSIPSTSTAMRYMSSAGKFTENSPAQAAATAVASSFPLLSKFRSRIPWTRNTRSYTPRQWRLNDLICEEHEIVRRAYKEGKFIPHYIESSQVVSPVLANGAVASILPPLINATSIRILYLLPTQPITVVLATEDLNDPILRYEAVSYQWTPEDSWGYNSESVVCNGKQIKVSRNLYAALAKLKLRGQPRALWIDRICINQTDEAEKSAQVGLMKRIYQQALRVIIWLGEDDCYEQWSTKAFKAICHIIANWKAISGELRPGYSTNSQWRRVWKGGGDQIPDEENTRNKALIHLFYNTYWTRLWIVQEIVSSSLAVVVWGHSQIAWTWIGLAASIIRHNSEMFKMVTKPGDRYLSQGLMNAHLMFRLMDTAWSSSFSYLRLMRHLVRFNVTKEHDRAYAILGLPGKDTGKSDELFVRPDYSTSLDSLYISLAEKILETDDNPLNLLSAVKHDRVLDGSMPSWVPRWDVRVTRSISGHAAWPQFGASDEPGERPVVFRDGQGRLNLRIAGYKRVSSVDSCTEIVTEEDLCGRGRLFNWLMKLPFVQSTDPMAEICLTLTAAQDWYGKRVEFDASLLSQHQANFNEFLAEKWNLSWDTAPKVKHPSVFHYKVAMEVCLERKVFRAANGRLGVGPGMMRPGDLVYIFRGGHSPYILRPAPGGSYYLVGECYLHGHMWGEGSALSDEQDGQILELK